MNSEANEEIVLPEEDVEIRYLLISKPLKIKGRTGFKLIITEGPIIIQIRESSRQDIVKFSEMKIVFNISALEESFHHQNKKKKESQNKIVNLFKLYPGSTVFVEDCDIYCENCVSKNKLICFEVKSKISNKAKDANKHNEIFIDNMKINNIDPQININNNVNINSISNPNKINYGSSAAYPTNREECEDAVEKEDLNSSKNRKEQFNDNNMNNNMDNYKDTILIPEKIVTTKNINSNNKESNKNNMYNLNNLTEDNSNINKNYDNISVLNIMSTKISKFYQTIRAGEHSIVNIEKSSINSNRGKSLVFLNPLIVKITGCIFEDNYDNAINIKFLKEESPLIDPRKIIFERNELIFNEKSGIYIDGAENCPLDLDLIIINNIIKRNKVDGIFICDLILNLMHISDNKIIGNKSNGIYLHKVYQKFNSQINSNINNIQTNQVYGRDNNNNNLSSVIFDNNSLNFSIIINNEFLENEGVGLFLNDCRAIIHNNSFYSNKASGMIISNINFFDIYNNNNMNKAAAVNTYNKIQGSNSNFNSNNNNNLAGAVYSNQNQQYQNSSYNNINNSSTKAQTLSNSSFFNNNFGLTIINECIFNRNGGSGLKIINYNNNVYMSHCKFTENAEFGIHLENDDTKVNLSDSNQMNKQNNNLNNNINNINSDNYNFSSISCKEKLKVFKSYDFSSISSWFERIINSIKINFSKGISNNNYSTNTVNWTNFNFYNYINELFLASKNGNINNTLNLSQYSNIYFNIHLVIQQNLNTFPKDFKTLNILYVSLFHSKVESNFKSGINLCNCFLLFEGNIITDNGEFAIFISKEDFKEFYKENRTNNKNNIDGVIGGPWGQIPAPQNSFCGSCFKSKKPKKNIYNVNNNRNDHNINSNNNLNKKNNSKNCMTF